MASAPITSVKAVSSPSLSARVSASGRLSLPAEVRRQVGLEKGGVVRIDMLDGAIRIRTVDEIKAHIRQLARTSGLADKASVADFLSWRRDERSAEGHGAEE